MSPDLIAALSPPAAPPGSTALPGGAAALTGSPTAALFASLLAATSLPAPTVSPAIASPLTVTGPPMHTTTVLSKISFSPICVSPGMEPTEPVQPTPKKPVLWETEHLGPAAAPVPPLLSLPTTLPTTPPVVQSVDPAEVTVKDAAPEGAEDAVKDSKKEPMDTAPARVPTGELLLPPPPPPIIASLPALPTATPPVITLPAAGVSAPSAVPDTAEVLAPAARLTPEAAPAPSALRISVIQPVPLSQAAPLAWTPPTDAPAAPAAVTSAAAVPSAAPAALVPVMLTGVGDSPAPVLPARTDKNLAAKTPQKDLKMTGSRADTYTRTQTELPRLTHLTRKDTPTEETSTEESRMAAGGTQGQGPAPTLTVASALQPRTTAAAALETKPLTPTERLAVVQQLADGAGGIRLSAPGAAQEMTVQLHPKDWGSLHVTVQIAPASQSAGDAPTAEAPKKVTAQIVAETPQVKAALESHSGELHQKLREAGLHLDSVTVTVRAPEAAHSTGTTPQGGQNDTQGRFQEGTQQSLNGGTQGSTFGQGGTQGSEFGQRLTDFSGRQDGSPGGSANSSQNNSQNSFQNNSQGGRQGSQTPPETLRWIGTEPDAEAAPRWSGSRHSGAVRLDLRA